MKRERPSRFKGKFGNACGPEHERPLTMSLQKWSSETSPGPRSGDPRQKHVAMGRKQQCRCKLKLRNQFEPEIKRLQE